MKEYDITITETLEKTVSVTAASKEEAEEKVRQGYFDSEYVLDADNFTQVDFQASEGREPARESNKIDVLLVKPGEFPQPLQVSTELEALQAAVGGDIQVVYPYEDPVGLVCNEEGKRTGLPLNRALRDEDGQIYDIIVGDFLVVGLTEDDFGSLTPEQMEKFEKLFHTAEAFIRLGRSIMAIPIDDEVMKKREKTTEKAVTGKSKSAPEQDAL